MCSVKLSSRTRTSDWTPWGRFAMPASSQCYYMALRADPLSGSHIRVSCQGAHQGSLSRSHIRVPCQGAHQGSLSRSQIRVPCQGATSEFPVKGTSGFPVREHIRTLHTFQHMCIRTTEASLIHSRATDASPWQK